MALLHQHPDESVTMHTKCMKEHVVQCTLHSLLLDRLFRRCKSAAAAASAVAAASASAAALARSSLALRFFSSRTLFFSSSACLTACKMDEKTTGIQQAKPIEMHDTSNVKT
jgi:hypothetical protein